MEKEIIKLYLSLVRNPHTAKPYRDLSNFYKLKNMKEESDGFEQLIKNVNNRSDNDAQQ